jgi:glycosyltransferase involved in cell wall biosynthesis
MKIAYISRNIPVPNIKENDIILRILDGIVSEDRTISIDCYFPREFFPKLPFIKNERIEAISNLPNNFQSLGITINSLKYIRLPNVKYSYSLIKSFTYLNSNTLKYFQNYDLIHAHNIMPDGKMGLVLKEKYGTPFIVTVRNGDLDKLSLLSKDSIAYKSYLEVLKKCDCIIVHNYATKKFVEELGFKYISIPHGIEENLLVKDTLNKENIILFTANLLPRKNLRMVINAFNVIANTEWKLVVLGDGVEYEELYEKTKNNKNIDMVGRVSRGEVLEYMKKSKVFVLPSDRETFGIVYLEAVASKCMVIGKKYTGVYEWLEDKNEAFFVENEEELINLFVKVLNDQALIDKISERGFLKLKSTLLWKQQMKKYIEVYRSLV